MPWRWLATHLRTMMSGCKEDALSLSVLCMSIMEKTQTASVTKYSASKILRAAICQPPQMSWSTMLHEPMAKHVFGIGLWMQMPQIPSQDSHGWNVTDINISIHWMDQPAPTALLQLIYCNCRKDYFLGGRCSCQKTALPCTDASGCPGCNKNQNTNRTETESSDADWTFTKHNLNISLPWCAIRRSVKSMTVSLCKYSYEKTLT